MRLDRVAFLILVALASGGTARGETRFVNLSNSAPSSPYTDWLTAATGIQQAVDVAAAGDTVVVTDGVYYLSSEILITNAITLQSVNGADVTIIDGSDATRCLHFSGCSPVIDGFTIRNGRASIVGGGIYSDVGGSIMNCTIADNILTNAGYTSGGGIYFDGGGLISNCVISGNYGGWGGGACVTFCDVQDTIVSSNRALIGGAGLSVGWGTVFRCDLYGNEGGDSSEGGGAHIWCCLFKDCTVSNNVGSSGAGIAAYISTITNCVIRGNRGVGSSGGGIWCCETSVVANCVIEGNTNDRAGGIALLEFSTAHSCIIVSNTAGWGGGAVVHASSLEDCDVYGNRAAYHGGGVYLDNWRYNLGPESVSTAKNCRIHGNTVSGDVEATGGGVYVRQGEVLNCSVFDNTAVHGGAGVYVTESDPTIQNCTIVGNASTSGVGGIYIDERASLANNIIYFNTSAGMSSNYDLGYLAFWFPGPIPQYVVASNNCTTPPITNDGSYVDSDPLFVDLAGGDLRLTSASPCIDAGATNGAPDRDLDGNARPLDGDNSGTAEYDIGAYEYLNVLADSDQDGLQDTNEVAIGTNPARADTDGDWMNDGSEVIAGTDPLDPASLFKMMETFAGESEIVVRWSSTAGRFYYLADSTNLNEQFSALATNIPANPPQNEYTDTVSGADGKFYRVSVER